MKKSNGRKNHFDLAARTYRFQVSIRSIRGLNGISSVCFQTDFVLYNAFISANIIVFIMIYFYFLNNVKALHPFS